MKLTSSLVIFSTICIAGSAIAEPVVTHNVIVQRNVSASQCSGSWDGGAAGDEITTSVSGTGQNNSFASPSIRSCTGCNIQGDSCVCKTCYDYTN